jgi:hypothetical protein
LTGHTRAVYALAFASLAAGQLIILSTGKDGTLRYWDATTGQARGGIALPSAVSSLAVIASESGQTSGGLAVFVGFGSDVALIELKVPVVGATDVRSIVREGSAVTVTAPAADYTNLHETRELTKKRRRWPF